MSRQYYAAFIGYQYDHESHSSSWWSRGSVSTASLQHFYESSVSQWRMSVVDHVYGLRQLAAFHCLEFRPLPDSEASHRADLLRGTISHQPCANVCHHWLRLSRNWKRIYSVVHSDSWWPPGLLRRFSWFQRRDINDFTYLLCCQKIKGQITWNDKAQAQNAPQLKNARSYHGNSTIFFIYKFFVARTGNRRSRQTSKS